MKNKKMGMDKVFLATRILPFLIPLSVEPTLNIAQVFNDIHSTLKYIKMGIINPRRACAARVTVVGLCVCVCVCLSVKSHLTYGASVRPENAVTYSAGNEGQKICGVSSETAPLQRSRTPSVDGHTYSRPFSCGSTHAHYSIFGFVCLSVCVC